MNKKNWRRIYPDEFATLVPDPLLSNDEVIVYRKKNDESTLKGSSDSSPVFVFNVKKQAEFFVKRMEILRRKANAKKT